MCSTQDIIKMHHADTEWRMGSVVTVLRIGSVGRLLSAHSLANVLNVQLSVCPYVFCTVASVSQATPSHWLLHKICSFVHTVFVCIS